jgi:endo-1,4-beta-xylanase
MIMKKLLLIALIIYSNTGILYGQLAADNCKYLGNVIAGSTPSDFTQYWNQVTPENAGKWVSVESTRDQMSWTALDNAYNTAKDNGYLFKQHTFVWGQQQPAWITDLTADEQKAEVEEWISEYCSRYPDTDLIDVVNEPLHAVPSYKNALGGNGTTGWDWVIWSFEKARQYCPNAKLILNDYNIISSNTSTDVYLTIIDVLQSRGLIDGIGEQGHFLESTPNATIKANLDKLAATGLPIHISEFDLDFSSDSEQKTRYEQLFPLLWNHYGVHGLTLWGYKESQIWRTNAYLKRANGTDRPAFTWLKDYVVNSDGGALCLGVATESEEIKSDVFPNPVTENKLHVRVDGAGYSLMVLNEFGKVVQRVPVLLPGLNEIELQAVPGMYFVMLSGTNQKTTFKKIVKY